MFEWERRKHVDLPLGKQTTYRLFRDGRIQNLTTGHFLAMRSNGCIKMGGREYIVTRLVAEHFLWPWLDRRMVVRLKGPEGGVSPENIYLQSLDKFRAELVEKAKSALTKCSRERRRKRRIYPVDHPARAAAIAKHGAMLAERTAA